MATPQSMTLTQFILSQQQQHPEASGDFSILMNAFEIASKFVSSKVRAAGLFALYGEEGSVNVQGEIVKKLDVLANEAFITSFRRSLKVSYMVSEENPEAILVEGSHGKYVAVFDPLDGSSNIDVNVSIGTIFGIYKRETSTTASAADVLRPGRDMVAAGYALYGSATLIVLSLGDDVNGFTLDPTTGEFVLTHPSMKIKPKGSIYSVNEGNSKYWYEPTKKYIESLKYPEGDKKPYSARYVGSMVADVHRTLLYGGIFMYPADKNSKDGKLRLLYEAFPMAYILEKAGGKASTGTQRVLDIQPKSIHQRTPIYLGSRDDVSTVERFFAEHADDQPSN